MAFIKICPHLEKAKRWFLEIASRYMEYKSRTRGRGSTVRINAFIFLLNHYAPLGLEYIEEQNSKVKIIKKMLNPKTHLYFLNFFQTLPVQSSPEHP